MLAAEGIEACKAEASPVPDLQVMLKAIDFKPSCQTYFTQEARHKERE